MKGITMAYEGESDKLIHEIRVFIILSIAFHLNF